MDSDKPTASEEERESERERQRERDAWKEHRSKASLDHGDIGR